MLLRGVRVAAVLAVLCVLPGCGDGSPEDRGSARGTVEALKDALVDGDAAALRSLLRDPGSTVTSYDLLTDEVLATGALHGQDVDVDKTDGSSLETVSYALRVDGRSWLEVTARRGGGLVGSGLERIDVQAPGVEQVTLNGVAVDVPPPDAGGSTGYLVPPGELEVSAAVPPGLVDAGEPVRVVVDADLRSGARVALDVRLTRAGRAEVDAAVRAWVRRCTEPLQGEERPDDCPVRKVWVGADLVSSRWTLDAEPTWTVDRSPSGFTVVAGRTPVARMTGTVRDRRTGATEAVTDELELVVSGQVRVRRDGLDVSVPGA